ncbi:MAG: hypothetical protein HQK77_08215 [Desulfobacterales bacterium]|nr:hypothetical protein [Desulfobacterales bacterium]
MIDYTTITDIFDGILIKEIDKFEKIKAIDYPLVYNLDTISCLVMSVEREREINEHSATDPPQRYQRESFLNDLQEMGIEINDQLKTSFQSLCDQQLIYIDAEGYLYARPSAFSITDAIDSIFPGMPSFHLIGYIIQTIQEVYSGRKTIDEAKHSLEQTLLSRGKVEPTKKAPSSQDTNQKQNYSRRLSQLLSKTQKKTDQPVVISKSGVSSNRKIEIRSLFGKQEPIESEIKPESLAPPVQHKIDTETEPIKSQSLTDVQPNDDMSINESSPQQNEISPKNDLLTQPHSISPEPLPETLSDEPISIVHPDRHPSESVADEIEEDSFAEHQDADEIISIADPHIAKPIQKKKQDSIQQTEAPELEYEDSDTAEIKKSAIADDLIELQIAEFEKELAILCPLCAQGKILSGVTEKGKVYYSCSYPRCKFISWSKPYHFVCPTCKNPFLIEFSSETIKLGLKCPRSTCSYSQQGILDPSKQQKQRLGISKSDESDTKTLVKRKRVVRRVKKN